jgi:tRNA(Ile)-lysidine synthase
MPLLNKLKTFFLEQGFQPTYWIAYSGGVDSHVLLHLAASLRTSYPIKIRAIHVNHSLSPHAEKWSAHCATICQQLQIDYTQKVINATAPSGESPEEIARKRRYALFSTLLAPGDILLTAHHQDDQAETVLLQLFRGAGPKGLAAMPVFKSLGQGWLARPLLNFTRADLCLYAKQHQLVWVEDESNENMDFSRNFLRQQIMPLLKQRWPTIASTLTRVSEHCAEAQYLLDKMAEKNLATVQGAVLGTLSVSGLLALEPAEQRQVIRLWLAQQHFPIPGSVKLHQIQSDVLQARSDKMPHMQWAGIELRRYRDDLYVMPCLKPVSTETYAWDLQQPLVLAVGTLRAELVSGQGLRIQGGHVTVRFRQGGETGQLPGRHCHHRLQKIFQEKRVPTWLRDRIPLIYVENQLVAAVGLFVSDEWMATEGQLGYQVQLEKSAPLLQGRF